MIDRAVEAVLAAAREAGATTSRIDLLDEPIEFCRNCRACTQEPGEQPGECPLDDNMARIMGILAESDAIVLASPVNFGTVTALTKRFIERLICTAYWPWGRATPRLRNSEKPRQAVLILSSAAPALLGRLLMPARRTLRDAAGVLGARTVGTLWLGMAAVEQRQELKGRHAARAAKLGHRLAAGVPMPGRQKAGEAEAGVSSPG